MNIASILGVVLPAFSWAVIGILSVWVSTAHGQAEGWNDATNTAAGHATMATLLNDGEVGSDNTAVGEEALYLVSSGNLNTAAGFKALYNGVAGYNTAVGNLAMFSTTSGQQNSAMGDSALNENTAGNFNTAVGRNALEHNLRGSSNTALGQSALVAMVSGSNNIAIGAFAGASLTSGSNNIFIGSTGTQNSSGAIVIGGSPAPQVKAYVAGISSTPLTGAPVFVTATGQLGVLASSRRYKTHILSIRTGSDGLKQLHPVTFHLKSEPDGTLQFGLIAEEVDRVYPELVIRDSSGRVQGVRYDELAPLLLDEMQRQQPRFDELTHAVSARAQDIRHLEREVKQLDDIERQARATLARLQAADERMAQR